RWAWSSQATAMRTPSPGIGGSLQEPVFPHRRPQLPRAQHLAPLPRPRVGAEGAAGRVALLVELPDARFFAPHLFEEVGRVAGAHDLHVRLRPLDLAKTTDELGLRGAVERAVDVVHEDEPRALRVAERGEEP